MSIVQITLPLFLIIATGYGLKAIKLVNDSWVHTLNTFAYYVSLPALIVTSFWKVSWTAPGMVQLVWLNTLILLGFAGLLLLILSSLDLTKKTKAGIFLTTLVGNTIYMGFPLVKDALGGNNFPMVIAAGTAHLTLGIAFSILATEFYVLKTKHISVYAQKFFSNPLVIAMIAGFILSFIPLWSPLGIIQKYADMLGTTASPVALFALGAFLFGKFLKHHVKIALLPVLLKLVLFPLAIGIVAYITRQSTLTIQVSTLIACMPTAVTAFIVAEKYKLDEDFVANCILLSTAFSVITIPLWLIFAR